MRIVFKGYKNLFNVLFALLAFSVSPAFADVSFTNSQEEFLADSPNVVSQNFLDRVVPSNQFANCNSPVNRQSDDACFTPGFILPGIEFLVNQVSAPDAFALFGPNYRGSGNPPNVLTTSAFDNTFDITFPFVGVNAVGVLLGCLDADNGFCNRTLEVQVYGTDNNLIGSTTVIGTNLFDSFLGVESLETIGRVSVMVQGPGEIVQGAERVWFRPVSNIPTLSEWGMMAAAAGLMIVGVFFAVRRRRAAGARI